jgi:hypothetical protein
LTSDRLFHCHDVSLTAGVANSGPDGNADVPVLSDATPRQHVFFVVPPARKSKPYALLVIAVQSLTYLLPVPVLMP